MCPSEGRSQTPCKGPLPVKLLDLIQAKVLLTTDDRGLTTDS
jgi:hypothetical protein